jgi:valyl-tRNA synthetase
LVQVLETLLRLTHPLMPFITEEIWQKVAPLTGITGETILLQPFPTPDPNALDQTAVAEIDWLRQFILGVRRIRAEMNIAPGKPLPVLLQHGSAEDAARLERNQVFLTTLGRIESITWLTEEEIPPESATALVGAMQILIPIAGLIDKEAEITRLSREIDKLGQELQRSEAKLGNIDFLGRAPASVVAKERALVTALTSSVAKLQEQLQRMRRL